MVSQNEIWNIRYSFRWAAGFSFSQGQCPSGTTGIELFGGVWRATTLYINPQGESLPCKNSIQTHTLLLLPRFHAGGASRCCCWRHAPWANNDIPGPPPPRSMCNALYALRVSSCCCREWWSYRPFFSSSLPYISFDYSTRLFLWQLDDNSFCARSIYRILIKRFA